MLHVLSRYMHVATGIVWSCWACMYHINNIIHVCTCMHHVKNHRAGLRHPSYAEPGKPCFTGTVYLPEKCFHFEIYADSRDERRWEGIITVANQERGLADPRVSHDKRLVHVVEVGVDSCVQALHVLHITCHVCLRRGWIVCSTYSVEKVVCGRTQLPILELSSSLPILWKATSVPQKD